MSETINPADVKAALRAAPSRAVREITIETESGAVVLIIRKPTAEALSKLQASWRERRLSDGDGKPATTESALEMNRELLSRTLYLPKALRPLFTPDELVDVAWVDDVMEVVLSVINTGKALENAKGN